MNDVMLKGNIRALLGEYRKALDELVDVIQPLSTEQLSKIVDTETKDPDCISVQNILTHVVSSGYGYTVYMEKHLGLETERPKRKKFTEAQLYIEQLYGMFAYCENFFLQHPNVKIEETNPNKKILTNWGQQFDIDQLMEHAIVHILRHRRQIERFIAEMSVH